MAIADAPRAQRMPADLRRAESDARRARVPPRRGIQIATYVAAIAACIAASAYGDAWRTAIYVGAIAWALAGPAQSIQALSISWLLAFLNPGLAHPGDATDTALRWGILAAAASRGIWTYAIRKQPFPVALRRLAAFVAIEIAIAQAIAYAPEIATLKLTALYCGGLAVLAAFDQARDGGEAADRWLTALIWAVILLSLPLYWMPHGYLRNGSAFQGILSHPQALGVFLAPAMAWLFFKEWGSGWRALPQLALLLSGLTMMYTTQARTSALAFLGAALLASLIEARQRRPARSRISRAALAALLVAGALLTVPRSLDMAHRFAMKGRYTAVAASFQESRGFLIDRSLRQFAAHPWLGIGFGLPSSRLALRAQTDVATGLPVGAPTEKGFAFVALLEETGILGTLLFLWFLTGVGQAVRATGSAAAAALALAALLVNFGESVLFAFGGMGLYCWLMLGWATAAKR